MERIMNWKAFGLAGIAAALLVAPAFAAGRALRTDGMLVLAKPEISHVYTHGARLP
jgi:hypothetical protein